MINQQSELQCSFSLPVRSANDVLNCSLETIKQMFAEYEVYEVDYTSKAATEKYLEIRFTSASLTCMFNHKLCVTSYLFLDNLEELNEYVNSCNEAFTYDYVLKKWQIPNGTATVKSYKGDVYFDFCGNK